MLSPSVQFLIPVIVGIAIAVQSQLVARIDRDIGTLESVLVTYGGGGALIVLIAFLYSRGLPGLGGQPWYVYTTGAFGLVIVGGIAFSVARSGLVTTFTIIVATQFILSTLIDHFGLLDSSVRALDLSRGAGIAMLLAGVWMILR